MDLCVMVVVGVVVMVDVIVVVSVVVVVGVVVVEVVIVAEGVMVLVGVTVVDGVIVVVVLIVIVLVVVLVLVRVAVGPGWRQRQAVEADGPANAEIMLNLVPIALAGAPGFIGGQRLALLTARLAARVIVTVSIGRSVSIAEGNDPILVFRCAYLCELRSI